MGKHRRNEPPRPPGKVYTRSDRPDRYIAETPVLEDGTKRYPTFNSREDAWRFLRDLEEGRFRFPHDRAKQTLDAYLTYWLDNIAHVGREETTIIHYHEARRRIAPYLGHISIGKLTTEQLDRAYAAMVADNYAPSTIHATHTAVTASLRYAATHGYIAQNPATGAQLPTVQASEATVLTDDELDIIFEYTRGDRWHALLVTMAFTGMRPGETLALRWSDVDFRTETIHIRHSVRCIDGRPPVLGPTKNRAAIRPVPMLPEVIEAIEAHKPIIKSFRLKQPNWQEMDLLFPNSFGQPMHRATLRKYVETLAATLKLPRFHPHDLRHTVATHLLEENTHAKIVQELIGHSRYDTTLRTYSHVKPQLARNALSALSERRKRPS